MKREALLHKNSQGPSEHKDPALKSHLNNRLARGASATERTQVVDVGRARAVFCGNQRKCRANQLGLGCTTGA